MTEKITSFLDVGASFGEAFLREFGRGIIAGARFMGIMIGEFALAALAAYFAMQLLEAQKTCKPQAHDGRHQKVAPRPAESLPLPKAVKVKHE